MPQITDNVAGRPLGFRVGANNSIRLSAKVGATAVAYTQQKITWDKDGWISAALSISTGTQKFYVGIPETAGTTGTVIEYVIGGPTKIITTGVFIAGVPALLSTGAAVISATTSLVANGQMAEIGIFREALPTTAVSTSAFTFELYGAMMTLTS